MTRKRLPWEHAGDGAGAGDQSARPDRRRKAGWRAAPKRPKKGKNLVRDFVDQVLEGRDDGVERRRGDDHGADRARSTAWFRCS